MARRGTVFVAKRSRRESLFARPCPEGLSGLRLTLDDRGRREGKR